MGNTASHSVSVHPTTPATVSGAFEKQFTKQPGSHIVSVPNEEFARRDWHLVLTCSRCGMKQDTAGQYVQTHCSCGGKLMRMPFFPPTADDYRRQQEEFERITCPRCAKPKQQAKCIHDNMGFYLYECPCGATYSCVVGSNVAHLAKNSL